MSTIFLNNDASTNVSAQLEQNKLSYESNFLGNQISENCSKIITLENIYVPKSTPQLPAEQHDFLSFYANDSNYRTKILRYKFGQGGLAEDIIRSRFNLTNASFDVGDIYFIWSYDPCEKFYKSLGTGFSLEDAGLTSGIANGNWWNMRCAIPVLSIESVGTYFSTGRFAYTVDGDVVTTRYLPTAGAMSRDSSSSNTANYFFNFLKPSVTNGKQCSYMNAGIQSNEMRQLVNGQNSTSPSALHTLLQNVVFSDFTNAKAMYEEYWNSTSIEPDNPQTLADILAIHEQVFGLSAGFFAFPDDETTNVRVRTAVESTLQIVDINELADRFANELQGQSSSNKQAGLIRGLNLWFYTEYMTEVYDRKEERPDPKPDEGLQFPLHNEVWMAQDLGQDVDVTFYDFMPKQDVGEDTIVPIETQYSFDYFPTEFDPSKLKWNDSNQISIDYSLYKPSYTTKYTEVLKQSWKGFTPNVNISNTGYVVVMCRLKCAKIPDSDLEYSDISYFVFKAFGQLPFEDPADAIGFVGEKKYVDSYNVLHLDVYKEDEDDEEEPDDDNPPIDIHANGFQIYAITPNDLKEIKKDLWTISSIEDFFTDVNNSVMENMISLKVYPCEFRLTYGLDQKPVQIGTKTIIDGRTGQEMVAYDASVLPNKFKTNSIKVVKKHSYEFLNYSPHVSYSLYLPFAGLVPLKAEEIVNKYLSMDIIIDWFTGSILYQVRLSSTENGEGYVISRHNGMIGQDRPFSGGNFARTIANTVSNTFGIAKAATSGNVGSAVTNALTSGITGSDLSSYSGHFSNATSLYDVRVPQLFCEYQDVKDGFLDVFKKTHGLLVNSRKNLGSCKGFTICENVNVEIDGATEREKEDIKNILESGIYL